MSENKSKRKYIVVAIVAALLLVGGTITAVCIANSNNNAVQVAEQSDNSSVQSSVAESSIENTNTESSAVSENSTKENSATAETSKTAQESSNTSSKAETSKTETSSKPETSKAESSTQQQSSNNNNQTSTMPETSKNDSSTTPPQSQRPTSSENSTHTTPTKPSTPSTIAVTSISLDRSSVTLTVGDKVTLVATVNPGNATNKSYEFSSSNNDVATVNSSGTVVAKKAGSCTITVKSSNGKTAKCSVTVKAEASTGNNTSGNNGGSKWVSSGGDTPNEAYYVRDGKCPDGRTYRIYECPDIVKAVNVYRKKAGLSELRWYDRDCMIYMYNAELIDEDFREADKQLNPQYYDANGNYVPEKDSNNQIIIDKCRSSIDYMCTYRTINHASPSEGYGSSNIQLANGYINADKWVSQIKLSEEHWDLLMRKNVTALYCCYGIDSRGSVSIGICTK